MRKYRPREQEVPLLVLITNSYLYYRYRYRIGSRVVEESSEPGRDELHEGKEVECAEINACAARAWN